MGRGVDIPWVGGSIYTMGRGVIKFLKNLNFQMFKISKILLNFKKYIN